MTDGHATHAGVLLLQALEISQRTGAAEAADVCSELDVVTKPASSRARSSNRLITTRQKRAFTPGVGDA
jgi:hypothetical protein